jgi:hypothetical protein
MQRSAPVCHFVQLSATIKLRRINISAVEYLPSMRFSAHALRWNRFHRRSRFSARAVMIIMQCCMSSRMRFSFAHISLGANAR